MMILDESLLAKESTIHVILTTHAIMKNPVDCKGAQQFQVLNLFTDTLVKKDPSIGIVSSISDKWEISKDQKEYKFHLSPKAQLHNGDQLKAEDVLFSFKMHIQKDSESIIASYLRGVLDNIEVIDTFTIKFTLKGAYPPFLELLSMPGFGIISHKSTKNKVIGSGPYQFDDSNPDRICLKKYNDYPFPVSNINKFCFRIERDIEKTINLMNANEVHLAIGSPIEVALSKKINKNLIARPINSLVATHVFLNHQNPF